MIDYLNGILYFNFFTDPTREKLDQLRKKYELFPVLQSQLFSKLILWTINVILSLNWITDENFNKRIFINYELRIKIGQYLFVEILVINSQPLCISDGRIIFITNLITASASSGTAFGANSLNPDSIYEQIHFF